MVRVSNVSAVLKVLAVVFNVCLTAAVCYGRVELGP